MAKSVLFLRVTKNNQSIEEAQFGLFVPTLVEKHINQYSVIAHGVDKLSVERGDISLTSLATHSLLTDSLPPTLDILTPEQGSVVIAKQRFSLQIALDDNTSMLDTVRLLENRSKTLLELGGVYGQDRLTIPYEVPENLSGGELELSLIATDKSGNTTEDSVTYRIGNNEPPLIDIIEFSSYEVDGKFLKNYTDESRLNYGEFWVRSGETFRVGVALSDDAGLQTLTVYRKEKDGRRVDPAILSIDYRSICPQPSILSTQEWARIQFDRTTPTEYEIVLVDTLDQESTRTFLVHPLVNVAPEIRFTNPAPDQSIVAGTFSILVGLVASDDRLLTQNNVAIFADGVALKKSEVQDSSGGVAIVEQMFASIYDAFEYKYDVKTAEIYGHSESAYATQFGYSLAIPNGIIAGRETITLSVQITDSDGAVGRQEIVVNIEPDNIQPTAYITKPLVGFAASEGADFTIGIRGYDNVKVDQLLLERRYGIRKTNGEYISTDYSIVRTVDSIPFADFEPVTTVNIDSPEYLQIINVNTLPVIFSAFDNLSIDEVHRVDVWMRVSARDHSGNEHTVSVQYPVNVDHRPVIDVVSPLNGSSVVESNKVDVNVAAFDDVGIEYVRLRVDYRNGDDSYELRLRQPPYSFQFNAPSYDSANPENNIVDISVEAVDNYGVSFGDLDKHRAEETLAITVVEDVPPTIVFGQPVNNQQEIEGSHLLIQINALDDLGLERVTVNVSGLINGDRTFTDTSFPYEFLLTIPYGQAGQDLILTASTTEIRYSGEPRTVETLSPVTVRITKDTTAPDLVVNIPQAQGATVVESRTLPYPDRSTTAWFGHNGLNIKGVYPQALYR